MSDTFFITMKYEVPKQYLAGLHQMESDGAIDQLAEILGALEGRRVVGVEFSARSFPWGSRMTSRATPPPRKEVCRGQQRIPLPKRLVAGMGHSGQSSCSSRLRGKEREDGVRANDEMTSRHWGTETLSLETN